MGDAEKHDTQELESLDNLEMDFQKVISDLVTDHSLDSFRVEYERVYNTFLDFHNNNQILVDKVRDLNSEILSNSTKVNSILKLSQEDQRTIAGLRFEFEKAWKMVEMSQDRESKSRDVIDQLKLEVQKLSRLVEAGGTMAFSQDMSLQSIQNEINTLHKEIAIQTTQIQSLADDLKESRQKSQDSADRTVQLQDLYVQMQQDIINTKKESSDMDKMVESSIMELTQTKDLITANQNEIEEKKIEISNKKRLNQSLAEEIQLTKRLHRDTLEEGKDMQSRVKLVQQLFEDKKKGEQKIQEEINRIRNDLLEKDENKKKMNEELEELVSKHANHEKELEVVKVHRQELQEKIKQSHTNLSGLRGEVYERTHEVIRQESELAGLNRNISLLQRQGSNEKGDVINEKHKTVAIEGQRDGIEKDIQSEKYEMHIMRTQLETVRAETEKFIIQTSDTRSNYLVIDSDSKIKTKETADLEIELSSIRDDIQKQESYAEGILRQRDVIVRQLEATQKESSSIETENEMMFTEIKHRKDLIREKDTECIRTHLYKEEALQMVEKLRIEIAAKTKALRDGQMMLSTLENTLMRSRYLCTVAENDALARKRELEKLQSDRHLLELGVHKKVEEVDLLKEKAYVIGCALRSTSATYSKQLETVEFLKADLENELSKLRTLMQRTNHSPQLKLECIRLEKSLLKERGKCKALEEELEQPMNVHRWRFLEGTNPEAMQMIRMSHTLRGSLMILISRVSRLKNKLKVLEEDAEKQKKRIQKTTNDEHEEEMIFYENILKDKARQLRELGSHVGDGAGYVDQVKGSVDMVRLQLRDTKENYFQVKKNADEVRKSINQTPPTSITPPMTAKFIGGGFGVGGVKRSTSVQSKTALGSIVKPRISSSLVNSQKIAPKRWNPMRDPLKPFLPTVNTNIIN